MSKVAMVLEGGSFRAQFTAGVLDVMLENKLYVPTVYGVSAGSLMGLSYVSRQIGRSNRINLAFRDNPKYMSVLSLIATKNILNADFLFNDIQDKIDPFDYNAFENSSSELIATLTDVETGLAKYQKIKNLPQDLEYLRGSSAMPMFSEIVEINDHKYLDGAIADNIPAKKALADGADKLIVVLTQDKEFIKQPAHGSSYMEFKYEKYPEFLKQLENRHNRYNTQRDYVFELEQNGTALIMLPKKPVEVDLAENNGKKLLSLYIQGRQVALENLNQMKGLLEKQ